VTRTLLAPPPPRRSWVVAEPDAVTGSWFPNLRAACTPTAPDQLWVADMTYLRVGTEAAFLAVILDAWSRKVIGYALRPVLDARLPLAALDAALDTRSPARDCIHHSDRGSQPEFNRSSQRYDGIVAVRSALRQASSSRVTSAAGSSARGRRQRDP
jgi:transposase InsO family protein